jgi:hypothetical protein
MISFWDEEVIKWERKRLKTYHIWGDAKNVIALKICALGFRSF